MKAPQKKIAGEVKEVSEPAFWSVAFNVNPDPIIYAFLGAYFFSLQMLFRRFVSEDLRKTAYLAVSLRIVLAVIGTWAAITAMKGIWAGVGKDWLLVVGFVIGVFPRIAWQFIQGAWKALMQKSGLSAALPSMESRLPVSDLDGLTVWHEARLEEEDIENIPNMATTEIVDLMLSTHFPPGPDYRLGGSSNTVHSPWSRSGRRERGREAKKFAARPGDSYRYILNRSV